MVSKEFAINGLIRKDREIEAIRARLIVAEQSGFTTQSRAEILAEIKVGVQQNSAPIASMGS